MKQFWCTLVALAGLAGLAGQPATAQPAVLPPRQVACFDAHDHRLPSATGAAYRLETVWRDSVAARSAPTTPWAS